MSVAGERPGYCLYFKAKSLDHSVRLDNELRFLWAYPQRAAASVMSNRTVCHRTVT